MQNDTWEDLFLERNPGWVPGLGVPGPPGQDPPPHWFQGAHTCPPACLFLGVTFRPGSFPASGPASYQVDWEGLLAPSRNWVLGPGHCSLSKGEEVKGVHGELPTWPGPRGLARSPQHVLTPLGCPPSEGMRPREADSWVRESSPHVCSGLSMEDLQPWAMAEMPWCDWDLGLAGPPGGAPALHWPHCRRAASCHWSPEKPDASASSQRK